MLNDLIASPLLTAVAVGAMVAAGGFLNKWFTRRSLQEEAQVIRLEAENAEARRAEAAKAEAALVRADVDRAAKEQKVAMDAQDKIMAQIHKDTNSAVQAWEKVETELRTKIEKTELAATSAASTAALALQTAKDLASRDLDIAKESIARLATELAIAKEQISALTTALAVANEKIAALTQQLVTTSAPMTTPATGTQGLQAVTIPGDKQVTVPEMQLPVEDAKEALRVITP